MSELPHGWATASLGDLCEIARGGSPRPIKDYLTSDPNGINWVKIGDATASTKYIFETREKIRPEGLKKSRLVKNGDFLLSNSMSFGRPYIMRTTGCIHDGWLVLRDRAETFDQDYLYHFLGSASAYQQFDRLAAGTTVRNLNSDLVKDVEVLLPPIAEQTRIASKIDSLTGKSKRARDHLDHIPRLVDKYKQAVLAAAFGGRLTRRASTSGIGGAAVTHSLEQLASEHRRLKTISVGSKPEAPFELPSHWRWTTAEMVVQPGAEIVYGIVQPGPKLQSGVPYVRGTDIENGCIKFDQLLFTSKEIAARYERASLRGGDILLGIIRATKVAVVPDELTGGNITQGTARFRPSRFIRTDFLARWLESQSAQSWLHSKYRGIDMPGLNLRDVRQLPIPLPPLDEQRFVALSVERAFHWIDRLASEATSGRKLIDNLDQAVLAKAFRGELVPQDPNDEPASNLLERIRGERSAKPKVRRGRQAAA
ncbi:restriction endonuclease subunit S [Mesorhizobium sp. M0092]|uniref:restriction endonuclease subunit S n=1 Tax=Mesorhizobium sp. M0092 TaxID=2956876 RepID=UPI0033378D22